MVSLKNSGSLTTDGSGRIEGPDQLPITAREVNEATGRAPKEPGPSAVLSGGRAQMAQPCAARIAGFENALAPPA